MILYPAIDLLEGQVVRLVEGDFEQKTVFAKDPSELLQSFAAAGATHAHLVDLSGARNPADRQTLLLARIIPGLKLKIQVGGGIRALDEAQALLDAGAERVVLGSVAVTQPNVALAALERFGPERLTLALDVRLQGDQPMVMTHGWAKSSGLNFAQVLEPLRAQGLRRVLCTDIAVDGRPVGPNLDLYRALLKSFPDLELQASGGVARLEDLTALNSVGVHSVVVGRALLSGAFTLAEALRYAQ